MLTLWFKLVVQREMQGESFLVNFADDFVAGFQYILSIFLTTGRATGTIPPVVSTIQVYVSSGR